MLEFIHNVRARISILEGHCQGWNLSCSEKRFQVYCENHGYHFATPWTHQYWQNWLVSDFYLMSVTAVYTNSVLTFNILWIRSRNNETSNCSCEVTDATSCCTTAVHSWMSDILQHTHTHRACTHSLLLVEMKCACTKQCRRHRQSVRNI